MANLLPAPLHRALLPLAHALRHRWRVWQKAPIAGVSVIVTNLSGDVLLLRHSYGPDVWSLPGGGLSRGEDALEAARREVREELGIVLVRIEPVAVIAEEISGSPHTAHLFTAICDQRPRPDRREIVEARFFPSHSLPEPLGRITRARINAWNARGLREQG
jgi:ADP-ribose pyrophosphatase YjhB (NUDIX family)